ncbi:MAG: acyl carrier protein [Mariniphaga sp.]|nr:acyl carrier protein [Mariniphaga sp.]MDD4425271.1 acyl carrier protein [Mariniphaga sp.]
MDRSTVIEKTLAVFRKVFGDISPLNEQTSANEIVKWDSLNHIILIQELEKTFEIRFNLFEIIEIRDIAGLVNYICATTTS